MIKYKKCNCDDDNWEEITVQKDNSYSGLTVIYYHCAGCGKDFRVENFETGEEIKYNCK